MKHKVKTLIKHPLIYGSAIVVFGNLLANFFNFLFNLFMLKELTPAHYGILATVSALISFPALAANAVGPLVMKFAGEYFAKGQLDMVRGLYFKISKIFFVIGGTLTLLLFLFINQVSQFFHIPDMIILVLTNVLIFFVLISVINIAFLQAKLAFGFQVIVNLVGALLKLLLGIPLVSLGFSSAGAVFSVLISVIGSYIVSFIPIRFVFHKAKSSPIIQTKELFAYGIPSAITLLCLTSFISSDIILVKHFFDPTTAGLYAGIALLAKVIFYIAAPIGTVMFPLIVQKHARNENFTNTFKLSVLLVFVPSIILTFFYAMFPNFAILAFTGGKVEYLKLSPILGLFGLNITMYCLLQIIVSFYLSIKKTFVYIPALVGAILQIILINLYHETFFQIISITLSITFVLVCGLLAYYPRAVKK